MERNMIISVNGFEEKNNTGYPGTRLNTVLEAAIQKHLKTQATFDIRFGNTAFVTDCSPKLQQRILDYAKTWWASPAGEKWRKNNPV
jgi:hypothetical protein